MKKKITFLFLNIYIIYVTFLTTGITRNVFFYNKQMHSKCFDEKTCIFRLFKTCFQKRHILGMQKSRRMLGNSPLVNLSRFLPVFIIKKEFEIFTW